MARARIPVEVWVTVAASLGGIGALLWVGQRGWDRFTPNEQIAENRYFCEALRDGLVRQPANTWSNLAFVIVAIAIARHLGRRRLDGERPATLIGDDTVARAYVALVAFLGVGSMCLHASLTDWGGLVDVSSMLLFIMFVATYAVACSLRLGSGRFLVAYAIAGVSIEALYLAVPSIGIPLFGAIVGVFTIASWRWRTRWLLGTAASFAVGLAVWIPSQNGRALCVPRSLLQGHAAWHVLCAAAAGFLFLHFRAQRTSSAGSIGG